jgi:outer membrane protein TolC
MKKIVLVLFTVFFIQVANAQKETLQLSLKEAIEYALKNSYNTKIAKNDIKKAKEIVWETTAVGLPQVNARIDYQNFLKQPVSLLPAGAFDNRESVVETVEEFFDINRATSPEAPEGFIPVIFGTKQNINASVTLTQLIFDGSYLVGLQASKTFLKISKQAEEKTELLTREAVINAYGNVLVTEKSIEILRGNIKILE